jgi:uncharacterized membrane protein YjgN (DUF898 family)
MRKNIPSPRPVLGGTCFGGYIRRPGTGRPRRLRFTFTGKASEYFGIWIVNTLLKIVTIGLYSPWAKVRKRRYFYGNTLLDQANFDYLANPFALLKGWLIAAALFILYTIGSRFSPLFSTVLGITFFFSVPWLIVRSRMFNNRNSAHRSIRFDFSPNYKEAYKVFAWLPALTPFTLGLLAPYTYFRQKRFLVENGWFGQAPFEFDGRAGDFYKTAAKALLLFLVAGGGMSLLISFTAPVFSAGAAFNPVFLPIIPALIFLYLFLALYVYVNLTNLTWNGTHFAGNRFRSTLRTRNMFWIYLSNAVAIALSLGLLIPWATIRLARYRIENLALETRGDLGQFLAAAHVEIGTAGEEIGEIFGVEVGF